MNAITAAAASPCTRCELRYPSLFDAGRALAFPCDADGRVPMDELGAQALANYLYARALLGRDYGTPVVVSDLH